MNARRVVLSPYWQLQIPGLSVAFVVGLLYCQAYYGMSWKALAMDAWSLVVITVTIEVMHARYRRLTTRRLGTKTQLFQILATCLPAGVTTSALATSLDPSLHLDVPGGLTWIGAVAGVTITSFFYTTWSVLYFALKHKEAAQAAEDQLREAQALATQAELAMLRYQLNPHFLFNSLTSLRAQILDEPDKARIMTGELAAYLRYVLREGSRPETTLGEEVDGVERYLALEKVRFEERLEVRVEVSPEALRWPTPSFLLQPLVENAIKHGGQPLRIEISAQVKDANLEIVVANTGEWHQGEEGIGLPNLRRRLQTMLPGRHDFRIGPEDAGWVRARIMLR